jgi:carboxypeptidase-like protein
MNLSIQTTVSFGNDCKRDLSFMIRVYISLFSFLLVTTSVSAQSKISGTIIDKSTQAPVYGASVFIANTTLGVITDQSGGFEIADLPEGFNKIVVNMVGFKSFIGNATADRVLAIELKPDLLQQTASKTDKKEERRWKKLYSQFEKAFLGISINANQSKILNPWVIKLDKDATGKISAYSVDLIQIENKGTGYMINYLLESAEIHNGQIKLSGKALFTELEAKNGSEIVRWEKNRERTFLGSRQHFLMALANDKLETEGFEIFNAKFDNPSNAFTLEKRLAQKDILTNNQLIFKDFIGIIYINEAAEPAYVNENRTVTSLPDDGPNQVARGSHAKYNVPDNQLQESFLFNRASKATINNLGDLKNPEYIADYGYWKWERAAELLPKTYKVN